MPGVDETVAERQVTTRGICHADAPRAGGGRGRQSPRLPILANRNRRLMKTLSVQIQPSLVPEIDPRTVVASLAQLAGTQPDVQEAGDAGGHYINVSFLDSDTPRLWKAIESRISMAADPLFKASKGMIIVCEGEKGWTDYLLLYHFDKQIALDTFKK